ncbi:MAG: proline--tRNA ligase [bacterium]
MKNQITPKDKDFAEWYQNIIDAADLAEHSEVRGAMVIKPYGYALWENIQQTLDKKIKKSGAKNVYFPMLIPESYLHKEAEHVEGFSPELAVVTHAGGKKLEEPYVLRPTSETIINATFAKWINSYRDLPMMINQWANIVRWELRPRLFLRTTEFLWQEGHTAHATSEEAEEETQKMLEVYKDFSENYLAIPVEAGIKTEAEKFAGADHTYTIEGMMQDGKALQMGTSHHLGQNFAKAFGVKFLDENNKEQMPYQTSWGVSTRLIGGLIMAHSDDKGLVLPPQIAPYQVVVLPLWKDDKDKVEVVKTAKEISESLKGQGVRVEIDLRDFKSLGEKIYEWEKKGAPIRLEIGPKEIASKKVSLARRDEDEKSEIAIENIIDITKVLVEIQKNIFSKAEKRMKEKSAFTDDYKEFVKKIDKGFFVYAFWCGNEGCETKIKNETKATIRCLPFSQPQEEGNCIKCGGQAKSRVLFARAY